jgi:hypothetical protein
MARRAKPTRRTRIADKAPPALTPEQKEAREAFFEAIDAKEQGDWKLGDLANHWISGWKKTARYRGFRRFYEDVILLGRKDTAPSYSTLTLYGRVAGVWPVEVAIAFGMAKLALLYSWLTLKQLPFPADPANVKISIPQDGSAVVKSFADASEQDLKRALAAAKKPSRPSTPLTARESWLIRRIDQGLEEYQPGGSALLHASAGPNGLTFALSPSPAAHFIELIVLVHEALQKDVPGDAEPHG